MAESSIVASLMYTLIDRKAVIGQGNLEMAIQGTIRGWHRVAVAVRRGGTRQFHPFTDGCFPCAVGNVARSGLPGTTNVDANAE